jgi:glycosyltransferase involved in cell wall biosynthesis
MDHLTVALDVAPLHGHRTGVGTAVAHLVDALARRDDVTVRPYLVSFRARPSGDDVRLPIPAALAARLWSLGSRPRVDRWLGGADVVHGTNYVAPPSRLPTVVSVYDCWFLRHPEQAAPDVRRAAAVLRRAVERGAHVHVSSQATADSARELLDTDRVHVVHLGPPTPLPVVTSRDPGPPYLLALGTVERRKGLPTLVHAFGRLVSDGVGADDLRLVIAGAPGDDRTRLDGAIATLPPRMRDAVSVVGPVDERRKSELLAGARALVYPSLDEGFGFPILEAQTVGTPVVASRAGSIAEIGGAGVELAAPGDADELAEAIRRVVTDDERRRTLIVAGHANVTRFSWSRTAGELVTLYRTAAAERPR